jgi:hypothetical protein
VDIPNMKSLLEGSSKFAVVVDVPNMKALLEGSSKLLCRVIMHLHWVGN